MSADSPDIVVSVEHAIDVLNRLLEASPEAIASLVNHRVQANVALVDDPTAQCGRRPDGTPTIGLVGVLNAIFGADADGWGHIAVHESNGGSIRCFARRQVKTP